MYRLASFFFKPILHKVCHNREIEDDMGFHDNEESQLKTRKSRKHNIFPKEVLLLHRENLKELKGQ